MNAPAYTTPDNARQIQDDDEFPVLDLGPYFAGHDGAAEKLAAQLRYASENIGFYAIINHGVPQSLIEQTFEEATRFHAQDLDDKLALKVNEHNIGYMPMKGSITKSSRVHENTKPNLNEAFFVKRDLPVDHPDVIANKRYRGANQWPDGLDGFRENVVAYCDAVETLASKLLPIYALALDLPADFFTAAFEDPQFTLRMTHYPPFNAPDIEDNQFAIAPHTDSSFMTLLPQNTLKGLAIRNQDGEWFEPPVVPGSFTVNTGDCLHRWSNHRFLSTPHRVVNPAGQERYAIPFFFDPNIDYRMECIPTCTDASNPPKHAPTSYLEYMLWFGSQNYAHIKPRADETVAKVD